MLFAIAVFGSFLLLPLYFQTVRGESAMQAGLLLAPQGFGAMLVMPIAGQLTDRTGVGRIVLVGLTVTLAALLGLTQIGADTSYWVLGGILFVMGMGLGSTMMPIMSGAMQTLRRAAVARASTTVNILQQVGASIGTAVLSVTLAGALADRLPRAAGSGAAGAGGTIPDAVREQIAPLMAGAYGHTFWVAVGLLVIAFVPAALLPWRKPAPPVDEAEVAEDAAAAPVLVPRVGTARFYRHATERRRPLEGERRDARDLDPELGAQPGRATRRDRDRAAERAAREPARVEQCAQQRRAELAGEVRAPLAPVDAEARERAAAAPERVEIDPERREGGAGSRSVKPSRFSAPRSHRASATATPSAPARWS